MFGIYYFENEKCFNGELRQYFQECKFDLDYENSFTRLLSKIKNFRPRVVVVSFTNEFLANVFANVFASGSEFYVPCVLVLAKDSGKLKDLTNTFVSENESAMTIKKFLSQLTMFFEKDLFSNQIKDQRNQIISKMIKYFGFSPKLNGTIYLKDAIKFYVNEDYRNSKSITNVLKQVSWVHDEKEVNIERCLRTLINRTWKDESSVELKKIFKKKPSTKELLRTFAEFVFENDTFSEDQFFKKMA